jgi:hypothetical protein
MGYRTLFQGSGIHHSNTGLKITHEMYINGYFMLFFDLTPDRGRRSLILHSLRMEISGSNYSLADLCQSITFLLYLECDSTVLINFSHKVTTDF